MEVYVFVLLLLGIVGYLVWVTVSRAKSKPTLEVAPSESTEPTISEPNASTLPMVAPVEVKVAQPVSVNPIDVSVTQPVETKKRAPAKPRATKKSKNTQK